MLNSPGLSEMVLSIAVHILTLASCSAMSIDNASQIRYINYIITSIGNEINASSKNYFIFIPFFSLIL